MDLTVHQAMLYGQSLTEALQPGTVRLD